MSEWQPIATAPKDGTFCIIMYYDSCSELDVLGSWYIKEDDRWANWDSFWPHPTHWMPLPNPPNLPNEHPSEP